MTGEMKAAVTRDPGEPLEAPKRSARHHEKRAAAASPSTVVTRMRFAAPPTQVWAGLVLYEEIAQPPWHLRLLLPVPLRVDGRAFEVGAEAMCVYEGGYLLKRVTQIQRGCLYRFIVAEQQLLVGGGMQLLGGGYTLRELAEGGTEVAVETRYVSPRRPRWLWKPLERMVCRWFHRYLLRAMRREIESQ